VYVHVTVVSGHIDILMHIYVGVPVVVAAIVIVAVSVIVNDHHTASVVTAVTHCHSHFHSHHSAHRCTSHHSTGHTHSTTSVSSSVVTSIISTAISPIVVWIAVIAAIIGGRTRSHNHCLRLLFYYYSLSRLNRLLHNHGLLLWLHARVHLLLDRVAVLINLLLLHDGLTVWWLHHLLTVQIPLRWLRIN